MERPRAGDPLTTPSLTVASCPPPSLGRECTGRKGTDVGAPGVLSDSQSQYPIDFELGVGVSSPIYRDRVTVADTSLAMTNYWGFGPGRFDGG